MLIGPTESTFPKLYVVRHGQWCEGDNLIAYMYRGEDNKIYYSNNETTREKGLPILPDNAVILENKDV
jgi:hypothetical protein